MILQESQFAVWCSCYLNQKGKQPPQMQCSSSSFNRILHLNTNHQLFNGEMLLMMHLQLHTRFYDCSSIRLIKPLSSPVFFRVCFFFSFLIRIAFSDFQTEWAVLSQPNNGSSAFPEQIFFFIKPLSKWGSKLHLINEVLSVVVCSFRANQSMLDQKQLQGFLIIPLFLSTQCHLKP